MLFSFLMPKVKIALAAMLLVAISFAAIPTTMANAVAMPMSMSTMDADIGCMHTMQSGDVDQRHDCCDHGPGQPCPDDMDCAGNCASLCANPVFLNAGVVAAMLLSHSNHEQPRNARALEHLTRLNAPPPRA